MGLLYKTSRCYVYTTHLQSGFVIIRWGDIEKIEFVETKLREFIDITLLTGKHFKIAEDKSNFNRILLTLESYRNQEKEDKENSVIESIKKYYELFQMGIITEEEYNNKKKELLKETKYGN